MLTGFHSAEGPGLDGALENVDFIGGAGNVDDAEFGAEVGDEESGGLNLEADAFFGDAEPGGALVKIEFVRGGAGEVGGCADDAADAVFEVDLEGALGEFDRRSDGEAFFGVFR